MVQQSLLVPVINVQQSLTGLCFCCTPAGICSNVDVLLAMLLSQSGFWCMPAACLSGVPAGPAVRAALTDLKRLS